MWKSFVSMARKGSDTIGGYGDRRLLRVLFICLKYDYGDPCRGLSFENVNFFGTLSRMEGVECTFFPYDEIMRRMGRKAMNRMLLSAVDDQEPDVCFFSLFTDEIAPDTIRRITEESSSQTLSWFGDDHWRFRSFSRHWAPFFHWVATTDSEAVEKYRALGCRGIIKTQWGFNHHRCRRFDVPAEFDVTFVGQVHSRRRETVRELHGAGLDVRCWGRGWEADRLSQEEMIRMYSRSRINLNFVESSVTFNWKPVVKVFVNRRADDTLRLNAPRRMFESAAVLFADRRPQIKARTFEIPGSGGFLLTGFADNIEEYFVPGKEIALFRTTEELIEKARYYLAHGEERESIRIAGEMRARRDHTFEKRFRDMFQSMGVYEKVRQ